MKRPDKGTIALVVLLAVLLIGRYMEADTPTEEQKWDASLKQFLISEDHLTPEEADKIIAQGHNRTPAEKALSTKHRLQREREIEAVKRAAEEYQ